MLRKLTAGIALTAIMMGGAGRAEAQTASLFDGRTLAGGRSFDEQADAITRTVGPAALVDDGREIERAKTRAMETLLQRLTDRFALLVGGR